MISGYETKTSRWIYFTVVFAPTIFMLGWQLVYHIKAFQLSKQLPLNMMLFHIGFCLACQALMLFMFVEKNPRNWWKIYTGHVVKVDSSRNEATVEEIQAWLKTSCKRPWVAENATSYQFLYKRDAAMFKLAWG